MMQQSTANKNSYSFDDIKRIVHEIDALRPELIRQYAALQTSRIFSVLLDAETLQLLNNAYPLLLENLALAEKKLCHWLHQGLSVGQKNKMMQLRMTIADNRFLILNILRLTNEIQQAGQLANPLTYN